ncbi:MAG TPA: DUF4292 domain-containing protein [Dinghuibacter sp.]|jgi:hypothetical protein|uniref:DUF4292 domain-containing protein n=1 Tax=Dinghuibacter sp. TaxID=2024697 RepID=UPI002C666773|nr:DUF4292 domain-containing protein [Dinghuibacter sp.]HTJ14388.1 DUF4292 domain-containing protein [Dinghuibacter sp.]
MRSFVVFGLVAIAAGAIGSCRSTKKIQQVINKKDTTSLVIVHRDVQPPAPDSVNLLNKIVGGMYAHHIDFNTFSAKVRVDYSNDQGHQPDFTAVIHMKRDSIIWVDISGPLGIGGFRVLITPDTLRFMDKLANTYSVRPLSYLQDVAQLPLDLHTLQDLLVGNLVFFDSTRITSYRQGNNSVFLLSVGQLYKNLVILSGGDYRITHAKLDDVDPTRNRTADLTYDDYVGQGGFLFPTTRSIILSEKTRVDIELNFKQFEFNVPLTYPYNVPKKYKRK